MPCTPPSCSEGYFCHVAGSVRARYETHYSLLVSALIRIHSLCVASPGFHISIHASRCLPLLRCCDVSQSMSPTICTIQPQYLHSSAGSRTCSIVVMCFSSLCTGRSSSEWHDDVKKSAAPWPAVSVYQYVSDAATAICLGKAIVFVLPLPHLASFPAFCVSLSALTTSAFPSYHRITITAWLQ